MPAYLSNDWLSAMNEAVKDHAGLAAATLDTNLVIQNVITGAPTGTVAYVITLDHGLSSIGSGRHADADVSFTTDYATAWAINRGDENAQTAFMAGRLRIGGDTRVLIANQGALAEIDDIFARVRAETDDANPGEPAGAHPGDGGDA